MFNCQPRHLWRFFSSLDFCMVWLEPCLRKKLLIIIAIVIGILIIGGGLFLIRYDKMLRVNR